MASLLVTHLVASLLYDVNAIDPVVFAAVSVILGVALIAGFVPARRASRWIRWWR
jgi:hypothetical protein